MRLRVRRLRLHVLTENGAVAQDIVFPDGCVVLQSVNTVGKSSVLNSILYALGLEGMLGPSHDVPLPHAFTDWIEVDEENHVVLESRVLLEIEGEESSVLTVERAIKGNESRHLIKAWSGALLSNPETSAKRTDFFVRQPGAAKRSRGFHSFLESFIGWTLPTVPRYREDPEKLYMEAVWPLLYVEQKQGWSVIEGRFPTYLGIKQMSSRAIEFLLALDAYDLSTQRVSLAAGEARLRSEWDSLRREIDRIARTVNGVVENLPSSPTGDWPPAIRPRLVLPRGDEWVPISEERARLGEEGRLLAESELPRVENVIEEAERELSRAEERHAQVEREHEIRVADLEAERSQLASLVEKIQSTEADLQKHKDLRRLRDLGSDEALSLAEGTCPTCHQTLDDSLIPGPADQAVMGLDDNIAFLSDQLSAFQFMRSGSEHAVSAKERSVSAGMAELEELRRQIRDLRRTLVSDGRLPSRAAMQKQLTIERRLEEFEAVEEQVARELDAFAHLAEQWRDLQVSRSRLPPGELSSNDRAKLDVFRELLVEQVARYGLRSLDADSLDLSPDNYRPTHAGIDLQFDLSASDLIRTIWAYRLGLLEVGKRLQTNHPGLLIFDEPGQQEMASDSLREFLATCNRVAEGNQIIVATSEELGVVGEALEGTEAELLRFDDFILGWAASEA